MFNGPYQPYERKVQQTTEIHYTQKIMNHLVHVYLLKVNCVIRNDVDNCNHSNDYNNNNNNIKNNTNNKDSIHVDLYQSSQCISRYNSDVVFNKNNSSNTTTTTTTTTTNNDNNKTTIANNNDTQFSVEQQIVSRSKQHYLYRITIIEINTVC